MIDSKKLPKSVASFFYYFIRKQPVNFFLLFVAPLSIILETNAIPYALKLLVDGITDYNGDRNFIFREIAPALYLGSFSWIGLIVILRLQDWLQSRVIPTFEADIRMSVLHQVLSYSYNYFSNQLVGNIANKIMDLPKSIESIRMILSFNVIPTIGVVIISLVMMAMINPVFSLILGFWVIVQSVIIFYFVNFVNKISEENAEDKSILSGVIVDIISNIISINLFVTRDYEFKYSVSKQNKEKASNSRLMRSMNYLQICMDIPVTVMIASILYVLLINWQHSIITTGDFVFIFNMVFAVMYQMWHLGNASSELFRQIGVVKQALQIITCENKITDCNNSKLLQVTKGKIIFSDVSFCYNKGKNIFQNINVVIKPKQKVGLVGFSGSGKSTFINLILRLFDVQSGKITIDDQDITKVTQESLRKNIAMIPQDTSLFHRELGENIAYGKVDSSIGDIIMASKKAYCHDFIIQLPDKYDSLVGERGVKLSGGQRQRIAIARAILKDAPILILDEATSALDSVTEKNIQNSLYELMQDRTTIVIAHRISTLSKMDRILVFDRGYIVEDGTHEELLKIKGHYELMWQLQTAGFLPETDELEKTTQEFLSFKVNNK